MQIKENIKAQRGPMNSPHKWPVTRKMFPSDDVIMFMIYIAGTESHDCQEAHEVNNKRWSKPTNIKLFTTQQNMNSVSDVFYKSTSITSFLTSFIQFSKYLPRIIHTVHVFCYDEMATDFVYVLKNSFSGSHTTVSVPAKQTWRMWVIL